MSSTHAPFLAQPPNPTNGGGYNNCQELKVPRMGQGFRGLKCKKLRDHISENPNFSFALIPFSVISSVQHSIDSSCWNTRI
jgi:hypothetical protein